VKPKGDDLMSVLNEKMVKFLLFKPKKCPQCHNPMSLTTDGNEDEAYWECYECEIEELIIGRSPYTKKFYHP